MPKMKSHKGAAKRFEVSSTGKLRRRRANANHMLEKKGAARKRRLKSPGLVSKKDSKAVKKMLGV